MKRTLGFARTALIAAALAAVPAVAQDHGATGSGSGSGSAMGSGSNDMARTSPIETVRHDDDGFDLGWMGLLGLAGLAGLRRKRAVVHDHHTANHITTDRRV